MARNQEKAQSMLYRFREAQAAELGIHVRRGNERRPRLASSVKSLKDCERWRGEILREISRKVSKIQDFGLTDYEVRDLNDEINKLLREKFHWENQIIALGGANYKRAAKLTDDSGKEVPGMRGYKYFGRAKDLPGVKELLESGAGTEAHVEAERATKYRRFLHQPPAYYGDEDELPGAAGSAGPALLDAEREAEEAAWRARAEQLLGELGGEAVQGQEDARRFAEAWKMPRADAKALSARAADEEAAAAQAGQKRGATKGAAKDGRAAKRQKGADGGAETGQEEDEAEAGADADAASTAYFFALPAEQLQAPNVPGRQDMERFLLEARKKALRSEYIGA